MEQYGRSVVAISHTGASSMGTDWTGYEEVIDTELETLVELFQGARVSYEGVGAPQPTAGLKPEETYTADVGVPAPAPPAAIDDYGRFKAGLFQNALEVGHKLGVFASSDHISQHVTYGGVYVEEFTREGILEGFKAHRTVEAGHHAAQ